MLSLFPRSIKQACLIGLFFIGSQPLAADDTISFLERISSADRELSYQGVFVLRKADRIMSMQVSHAADENGIRENLVSLNGENRQVIRNNDQVLSIYPDRDYFIISEGRDKSALHPALPENLDKLKAFYDIQRLDDDRIANHETAVIRLAPRDEYRYGYQYWVDANTGVLLRCDMLDANDEIIEQMMFTQLDYKDNLPASKFEYDGLDNLNAHRLGANRTVVEDSPWTVSNLPDGFILTQSSQRNRDEGTSLHLVYSDGLASVSVFIEEGSPDNHYLKGATSMGALNAYGTRHKQNYVTVMGEVPASTVQSIAVSARLAVATD